MIRLMQKKREKRKQKRTVVVKMFTIIIILSDTELFSLQQYLLFTIIYFIKTETQHYLIYIDIF